MVCTGESWCADCKNRWLHVPNLDMLELLSCNGGMYLLLVRKELAWH